MRNLILILLISPMILKGQKDYGFISLGTGVMGYYFTSSSFSGFRYSPQLTIGYKSPKFKSFSFQTHAELGYDWGDLLSKKRSSTNNLRQVSALVAYEIDLEKIQLEPSIGFGSFRDKIVWQEREIQAYDPTLNQKSVNIQRWGTSINMGLKFLKPIGKNTSLYFRIDYMYLNQDSEETSIPISHLSWDKNRVLSYFGISYQL